MRLVQHLCEVTRKALEPAMPMRNGKPNSTGTCLYASYLLRRTLEQFADCEAFVRGGDGLEDGGILGADNLWHGHYWVEGKTFTGAAFVADITADQFGYDQIVVIPLRDARARYQPGADEDVRFAVLELDAELSRRAA